MERKIRIGFQLDGGGFYGRECPQPECGRYFKVAHGTGIPTKVSICPYCGFKADLTDSLTVDQKAYAMSVAEHEAVRMIRDSFKDLEFNDHESSGPCDVSMSFKVTDSLPPLHLYSEKELETEVICESAPCGTRSMGSSHFAQTVETTIPTRS